MKKQQISVFCQCHKCMDVFTLDAEIMGSVIVSLEAHRRVQRIDGHLKHHCGGDITLHPHYRWPEEKEIDAQ